MPVSEVRSGQTASFALKKVKRSQIRKGMVMVSSKLNPRACREFHGDIMVLHHPTTIATRYQVTFLDLAIIGKSKISGIIATTPFIFLYRPWCIVVQLDRQHPLPKCQLSV